MSRYLGGVDGYLTQPHFYGASANLTSLTRGMTGNFAPNQAIHSSYLNIEPLSGRCFMATKRLQLGFSLFPERFYPYSPWAKLINSQYSVNSPINLPLLWAEEGKNISDDDASSFRNDVYGSRFIARIILGVLVAVGGTMVITCTYWLVRAAKMNSETTTKEAVKMDGGD